VSKALRYGGLRSASAVQVRVEGCRTSEPKRERSGVRAVWMGSGR
jgi:hypothetical protein